MIGHLYVRFQCVRLDLPERGIAEIKKACGGEVTREKWMEEGCSSLVEIVRCVGPATSTRGISSLTDLADHVAISNRACTLPLRFDLLQ